LVLGGAYVQVSIGAYSPREQSYLGTSTGQFIADASIYLVMANLLATMDITKARDENGNEIEPEVVRGPALVW